MDKIRIGKVVFWKTANKTMTGKVKKVMSSHVVIDSGGLEYIVQRDILSTDPIDKIAKMACCAVADVKIEKTAAATSGMERIEGFEYEIDYETGEMKIKIVDGRGANQTNHGKAHHAIIDAFADSDQATVSINPGLPKGSVTDPLADLEGLAPEVKQTINPAGPKGPGSGPKKPPAPPPPSPPVGEEEGLGPTRIRAR